MIIIELAKTCICLHGHFISVVSVDIKGHETDTDSHCSTTEGLLPLILL